MTRSQLKAIAKRNGIVRWVVSGLYERVYLEEGFIVASSHLTRIHMLLGDSFDCVEVNPRQSVPAGELLCPRGPIPYPLIRYSHNLLREKVAGKREKRREKWARKIVTEVIES